MPSRLPVLILLSLAAALTLAACGGSGDRLSKADLANKADAVCKEANGKLEKLKRPTSADEITPFVSAAKQIEQDALDGLGKLKPPSNLEKPYKTYQELLGKAITSIQELGDAANAKDTAKIQQIQAEIQGLDDQAKSSARAIGFKECATQQ